MLFVGQLILGGILRDGLHNTDAASAELFWFAAVYAALAVWQVARARDVMLGQLSGLSGLLMSRRQRKDVQSG